MRFVAPFLFVAILGSAIAFLFVTHIPNESDVVTPTQVTATGTQTSQTHASTSTSPPASATSSVATSTLPSHATSTPKKPVSKPKNEPTITPPPVQAEQKQLPYSTPAESFESIDKATRAALVNILCMPQGGSLRPISGSGVIIDPRGVILTNAHVAQFVLLAESMQVNLICTIRAGSPATAHWKASVLYISPLWVNSHYHEINADRVVGTGEHDYALLLMVSDAAGNPVSGSFPYLPTDTRENITFKDDNVLGSGYPAEFVGGTVAQQGLFAVSSVSRIKQLLTFDTTTIDVLSIGGVIEAQGGSSGGPVVNAWRYVVGIITTTSEGATTADRDLHALSLNYINRDITLQTGRTLQSILAGNLADEVATFSRETAPGLVQKYIDFLSR